MRSTERFERKRDYNRNAWQKAGMSWCMLGLALIVVPGVIKGLEIPQVLPRLVPFFVILGIWFIAFFTIQKRRRQKLQQELDGLGA